MTDVCPRPRVYLVLRLGPGPADTFVSESCVPLERWSSSEDFCCTHSGLHILISMNWITLLCLTRCSRSHSPRLVPSLHFQAGIWEPGTSKAMVGLVQLCFTTVVLGGCGWGRPLDLEFTLCTLLGLVCNWLLSFLDPVVQTCGRDTLPLCFHPGPTRGAQ